MTDLQFFVLNVGAGPRIFADLVKHIHSFILIYSTYIQLRPLVLLFTQLTSLGLCHHYLLSLLFLLSIGKQVLLFQIFSMLIFPEFAMRLCECFSELTADPEGWSALSEFYNEFADCAEGPLLFSEICLQLANTEEGLQVVKH